MFRSTLFSILLIAIIRTSLAQNPVTPLVTDRPDFSESTEIVPSGRYQFEFGYTFNQVRSDKQHVIGELLARIPIHRMVELRVGFNSYAIFRSPVGNISGLQDESIGVKVKAMDDNIGGFLGNLQTAFILATTLPTGKDEFGEDELQPEFKLALGLPFSERFSASSNLNFHYASQDGDRYSQFSNSLSLGYALSNPLGVFLEYYGYSPASKDGPDASYLSGGFTYLFGADFQMDLRAGKGLNGIESEYFVGFGAAVRL